MKITKENLKKLKYDKVNKVYISKTRHKYVYVDSCKFCHNPFLGMISSPKIFCSVDCFKKYRKEIRNNTYKDGRTLEKHYCKICNKEISDYKSMTCLNCRPQNKIHEKTCQCPFCKAKRGELKGEKHPNYIDGRSFEDYPIEFDETLKEKIHKRDNYKCQCCGITEEEHIIVFGQVLHVHHINYNKKNCSKDNLITLCISCNTRANYNRSYWIEFYKNKVKI
jgi:hypothetical protein